MYDSRAVTPLVLISDDVINRILKLDMQTNILVYVTRCCTDLTSKVLKERTFGKSSAVLVAQLIECWIHDQEVSDSNLTVDVVQCPLSKTHYSPTAKYWFNPGKRRDTL